MVENERPEGAKPEPLRGYDKVLAELDNHWDLYDRVTQVEAALESVIEWIDPKGQIPALDQARAALAKSREENIL